MKVVKRLGSLTAVLLLTSMILSACGGTTATAVPPTNTTAAEAASPTAAMMMSPTAMMAMTSTSGMMMSPTAGMMTTGTMMMTGTQMMGTPGGGAMGTPMMTSTQMMTGTAGTPTAGTSSAVTVTRVAGTPVIVGEKGSKGVIKIAVDLPTSGSDASDGVPTRNGAQLAIEQANAAGEVIPGYKLQMYALDDAANGKHDPQQGAANVDQYIADDAVVAMVGPFNSNVAKAEMPKLNNANLANISPSNTNETLTKPEYKQLATLRPTGKVTYFRVCTTDDIQGPEGADYAYTKLGWKKVYVLDDQEAYGQGISNNFVKEFQAKGGTVVDGTSHGIPGGSTEFGSVLSTIAAAKPDGVYYGGTTSNGIGLFRKQMKDKLPGMPLFGGDGIVEDQFLKDAGDNANGAYGTVAAVDATKLPDAAKFIVDYKARFNSEVGSYSANAYDAASIIIAAIKKAGSSWSDTDVNANREAIRANIAATKDFHGVIGLTSFDANGDTTNKIISILEVVSNKWTVIDQARFGSQ